MNEDKKVSRWLIIIAFILVCGAVCLDYSININDTPNDIAYAIGATTVSLMGGVIALACANKCSDWAKKINKSMNFAYVIGFVFGLLGLLGYWIYFIIKEKPSTPICNKSTGKSLFHGKRMGDKNEMTH